MHELTIHIDQIRSLCGANKVKSLFAFGSLLREDFSVDSDIYLVVDIDEQDPLSYSNNYFNLKFQLEFLLNRKVDLLEHKSIRNPFIKEQIEQTKVLIYG
jgi:predicted nucleotidyltransferase